MDQPSTSRETRVLQEKVLFLQHHLETNKFVLDEANRLLRGASEQNALLRTILEANGLSAHPDPKPQDDPWTSEPPAEPSPDRPSVKPLTPVMRSVLMEVVSGDHAFNWRKMSPREQAGRGRTLDKLIERGLVGSDYKATAEGLAIFENKAATASDE